MKTTRKLLSALVLATLGFTGLQSQAFAYGDFDHGTQWKQYQLRFSVEQQRRLNEIDARLANQRQRIQQGFRTGKLTKPEFLNLMEEHRNIRIQEQRFLKDGVLGPREFASLDSMLDRAHKHIFFEKNDRESRYAPQPMPYGGYRH